MGLPSCEPEHKRLRYPTRRLLGIRVDDLDQGQVLQASEHAVRSGVPRQIVTINTEMLMKARLDQELTACIENAYLVVPDGIGLLLAGKLLSQPLRQRVAGSDLVPRLCQLAACRGFRPFFLGAGPGVASEAARRLACQLPGLRVAGAHSGSPQPEDLDAILRLVHAASPDILLVAYGVPAEEKWIARNLEQLAVPLTIGVGGSLDFVSGAVPRAPRRVQQLGLEWLYRLYRQPWRWRRMLALPRFLALVLAEAFASRLTWHR